MDCGLPVGASVTLVASRRSRPPTRKSASSPSEIDTTGQARQVSLQCITNDIDGDLVAYSESPIVLTPNAPPRRVWLYVLPGEQRGGRFPRVEVHNMDGETLTRSDEMAFDPVSSDYQLILDISSRQLSALSILDAGGDYWGPQPQRKFNRNRCVARLPLENDERQLVQMLYSKDPLFAKAAGMAADLTELGGGEDAEGVAQRTAQYAADRLSAEARIAAFSIGGWDTHASQKAALNKPLRILEDTILTLQRGLGAHWGRTLVVAMTEFGRTARENGNKGTDHGTGGAAVLAGGALSRAAVFGDWPGVADADLYKGRDLTPTMDVRHYPAWALHAMFGLDKTALEQAVFPGLDMGARAEFIA